MTPHADDPAFDPGAPTPEAPPLRFRRDRRLTHAREYQAAHREGVRKTRGPITVIGRPNGLTRSRLGLSVGRRAGGAARRSRYKRLIREAFRLQQHDLPAGFDLVVAVRAHEPMPLVRYAEALRECAASIERAWRARGPAGAPAGGPS